MAAGLLLWLVLLLVPHLILTRVLLLPRDGRVALATVWIGAATLALITSVAWRGRAHREGS